MTPQLCDPCEDRWPVKLHLGCGGVYLRGYVNCDLGGVLTTEPPPWATTPADYYAGLNGEWNAIPEPPPVVVDAHCDIRCLGVVAEPFTASKIIALQCLEHVDQDGARAAIREWYQSLAPDGVCIVTVPDVAETLEWLARPDRHAFAVRHLCGTHRHPNSWHRSFWTHSSLYEAMRAAGFDVEPIANPHFYPAACARGVKHG